MLGALSGLVLWFVWCCGSSGAVAVLNGHIRSFGVAGWKYTCAGVKVAVWVI